MGCISILNFLSTCYFRSEYLRYPMVGMFVSFRYFVGSKQLGRVKPKTDWLAQNQDNVCEWIDMPTRDLLFQ